MNEETEVEVKWICNICVRKEAFDSKRWRDYARVLQTKPQLAILAGTDKEQ